MKYQKPQKSKSQTPSSPGIRALTYCKALVTAYSRFKLSWELLQLGMNGD